MTTSRQSLVEEVVYLHRCFFRADPPPEVVDRYIAANSLICPSNDPLVDRIVAERLDPEAVELVLRRRHGSTLLTKKIRILFYLLEVRSAYYPYFFGAGESPSRASLALLKAGLQTALRYCKGRYLVRRYGLV